MAATDPSRSEPAAANRVLGGTGDYDSLDDAAQAIVRSRWREQIDSRLASLDLSAEFDASGTPYAYYADGAVRLRPDGSERRPKGD